MRKTTIVAMLCVAISIPAVALAASAATTAANAPDGGGDRALALRAIQHRAHLKRQRAEARRKARARKRAAKRKAAAGSTASPVLQAIAACESGGNPRAIGGGGAYRGKYQFSPATWASVGGSGDPAAASEAEQDRRAAMLYARGGASSWPVCGK